MAIDFDLCVIGEINPDLILRGDVAPAFGQVEKMVEDATLTMGSSSVIFACGAARLGLRVAFIGKVGLDEFGRYMLDEMAGRGIDVSSVVNESAVKTGLSVILSRGNDRAILTFSGSIGALRPDEIDWGLLARTRHLHIGSFYLLDALRPAIPGVFHRAKELGLTTSLDTNYDPQEKWADGLQEVLKYTDVFLPNETELCAIAREPEVQPALAILARMTPVVAVKLGAQGALAQRGGELAKATSLKVDVVDTVGAGDTFDAGFIYAFLNGWDLARALRLACVCGSLSTLSAGGTNGQPTLVEALEYLKD